MRKATRKRPRRIQYTNWPVRVGNKFSFYWDFSMVKENIFGSDIHMDEAYRDVNSRDWKNFDKDTHTFFATHRHNDNNIFLYSQSPARVDTVIREIAVFYWVRPFRNPISGRPWWFRIEVYDSEEALKTQFSNNPRYTKIKIKFKQHIANAYDTKQFRKKSIESYVPVSWDKVLGIEMPVHQRKKGFLERFGYKPKDAIQKPVKESTRKFTEEEIAEIRRLVTGAE